MVIYLEDTTTFETVKLRKIIEGSTEYWIPDPYFYGKRGHYLPFELPIFYNPIMEINRDLSVLATWAYIRYMGAEPEDILFIEALAGSGIRGARILNEVGPLLVILNDIDPLSYRFMLFNVKEFPESIQARVQVYNYDANYLLQLVSRLKRPDIIVIDPFGTPVPFIDNAIRALRRKEGLLLVTATDTAPLTGKFPNAALRKYGVYIKKTPFEKEIAVRVLVTYIQKVAAKYSIALVPVFGFFINHFVKVGFLSFPGKKNADKILKNHKWVKVFDLDFEITSSYSGGDNIIGPIWMGELFHDDFCKLMLKGLGEVGISDKSKEKLGNFLRYELTMNKTIFYYNLEHIASKLKKQTPKVDKVLEALRNLNYKAERTHFDTKAIKTNASLEVIREIVKKL